MIDKLVIATANTHKVKEIKNIFENSIREILRMPDNIGEIIEDGNSFFENALIKAKAVYKYTNLPSLADDSGICINALNGEPGIYSSRYGGDKLSYKDKMRLILDKLKNESDRSAYFITSAVCIIDENYFFAVEGRVDGTIIENARGVEGFGYDPIFIPNNYNITYAEMTLEEKNKISHRSIAMNKMKNILEAIHKL